MEKLGKKLVQMDGVPAVLHYADGGQDGPLEIQPVQVDEDTVNAVIHVQGDGIRSVVRIMGGMDDARSLPPRSESDVTSKDDEDQQRVPHIVEYLNQTKSNESRRINEQIDEYEDAWHKLPDSI